MADLSAAIKKFVQDEMRTGVGVRSLSLHLGNSSENSILHFLENSYGYLSSLKLHGALSGQTQLVTRLHGLTESCLSSTNNLTSNDLSNLRKLKHLEYVKLVNVSLGEFIIGRRDFPRLLRLCLVQCPTLPTVEEGALPKLISLHLLCENLVGLAGIKIEQHKQIQEVALDSMASQETAAAWEDAAKKHPKRPRVLFFRKICSNDSGSMVKYVATERPSSPEPLYGFKRAAHYDEQRDAMFFKCGVLTLSGESLPLKKRGHTIQIGEKLFYHRCSLPRGSGSREAAHSPAGRLYIQQRSESHGRGTWFEHFCCGVQPPRLPCLS
ncbi:hypothetical protein U9M48_001797 [Paspalum notatum var. saurae]|uniref:Uncharacterized protein n=1 Tax=Paspalum notatum var. saurae TaxID=547442 RepID=A0AAQ3PIM3_PASNO